MSNLICRAERSGRFSYTSANHLSSPSPNIGAKPIYQIAMTDIRIF
jgi:hypothetical protein